MVFGYIVVKVVCFDVMGLFGVGVWCRGGLLLNVLFVFFCVYD